MTKSIQIECKMKNAVPVKDRPIIGVMGGASCSPEEYALARQVGKLIAVNNGILLCGGGSGVMQASARGAKEGGGLVIGILPGGNRGESEPNEYIDVALFTGMSDGRNVINAKSSDVIIAIAGEFGTLSEIALALKCGKRVFTLGSWDISRNTLVPDNYICCKTPEEAVEKAFMSIVLRK